MGNNQSDRLEKDGNTEAALSVEAAEGQVEVEEEGSATNPDLPALVRGNGGRGGIRYAAETRTLCRTLLNGWVQDESRLLEARDALRSVINQQGVRPGTKAIAAKALAEVELRIVELSLKVAEADDKAGRLDEGKATENIAGITMVIREADSDDG